MTGKAHSKWGGKRPGAGRPSGSYTTWHKNEFYIKRGFLIETPHRCYCGNREYRYKFDKIIIYARCNTCNEVLTYDATLKKWRFFRFFG